jgi:hypothetical protein
MKTNIVMRVTPEQSRKVQEIAIPQGANWYGRKRIEYEAYEQLFLYNNYGFAANPVWHGIAGNHVEQVDPELFIRTNGTCEFKKNQRYNWFSENMPVDGETIITVIYGNARHTEVTKKAKEFDWSRKISPSWRVIDTFYIPDVEQKEWKPEQGEKIMMRYREKYMDLFFKCMELGREGHISEHGINYILGDEPLPNSSE